MIKKMLSLKETKRLKLEIEERPSEIQKIIENTDLGICITDAKGNFVAVNDNYTQIYGYSKEELIGNHFGIVVPNAKKEDLKVLHDNFIKNKFEILRNWEVQKKTGEIIKIQVDAGYTEKINRSPHKITFIMVDE